MSASNATLYYSAMDDMFKDLQLESSAQDQVDTEAPLTATPKRLVRIRQQNLFAQDKEDFVICRRNPTPVTQPDLSPRSLELRKHLQKEEMLRQRLQRREAENKRPMRRLTMRI